MIIDIHTYIGKWPHWPLPVSSTSGWVETLAREGVDTAVICSTRSLFVSWEDGNREAEDAVSKHPKRLLAFACLGPTEFSHKLAGASLDFDSYDARGFRGIRLYPQYHSYHPLYEPFVERVCQAAEVRSWPVFLPLRAVMNWGAPTIELNWMVDLVERFPRTQWILAGINYFQELRVAIQLMRRHPSVHLETSCVQGFNGIEKLVQECGSRQVLFGSGAPLQCLGAGLQKVLHANLADPDREAILGGNARQLLHLG